MISRIPESPTAPAPEVPPAGPATALIEHRIARRILRIATIATIIAAGPIVMTFFAFRRAGQLWTRRRLRAATAIQPGRN
jgi:hypothetical protein